MRRHHPLTYTRPNNNLGHVFMTFIAMLVGVIVVLIFFMMLAVFFSAPRAHAWDRGQWEGSDLAIRSWYKSLMQPDNPGLSCCGEADAYWADKVDVIGGKVYATITDTRDDGPLNRRHIKPGTRFEIPPHKMKFDRGNPTGHVVIFIGVDDNVLCFVQGGGV
jgi:hypothetical protein